MSDNILLHTETTCVPKGIQGGGVEGVNIYEIISAIRRRETIS